jgi:hypothetical protein
MRRGSLQAGSLRARQITGAAKNGFAEHFSRVEREACLGGTTGKAVETLYQ